MFHYNIKTIHAILAAVAMWSILTSSNKMIGSDQTPTGQEQGDSSSAKSFLREGLIEPTISPEELNFVKSLQTLIAAQQRQCPSSELTSSMEEDPIQQERRVNFLAKMSRAMLDLMPRSEASVGYIAPASNPSSQHSSPKASSTIPVFEESKEAPSINLSKVKSFAKSSLQWQKPSLVLGGVALCGGVAAPVATTIPYVRGVESTSTTMPMPMTTETSSSSQLPESPKETRDFRPTMPPKETRDFRPTMLQNVQEFLHKAPASASKQNTAKMKFSTTASHVVCKIDFIHDQKD